MSTAALSPSRLQRRWRSSDSDQRRALIIDTALDLLRRRGLAHVTMRRVAQRLGVGTMTLYTYIDDQASLHRQMTRRGFALLQQTCHGASTLGTSLKWRGGSRAYLQFAQDNPNLYKLMFDVRLSGGTEDEAILRGGFGPLIDKVLTEMQQEGLAGAELHQRAHDAAARFWFALHGLASLIIAGRTSFLNRDLDQLLDDLLQHVAPT